MKAERSEQRKGEREKKIVNTSFSPKALSLQTTRLCSHILSCERLRAFLSAVASNALLLLQIKRLSSPKSILFSVWSSDRPCRRRRRRFKLFFLFLAACLARSLAPAPLLNHR